MTVGYWTWEDIERSPGPAYTAGTTNRSAEHRMNSWLPLMSVILEPNGDDKSTINQMAKPDGNAGTDFTLEFSVRPSAFRATKPQDLGCQGGRKRKMEYIWPALMADRSVHLVPPMFGFSTCRQ